MEPIVFFLLSVGNEIVKHCPNEPDAILKIANITYRFIFINGKVSQIATLNNEGNVSRILYNPDDDLVG